MKKLGNGHLLRNAVKIANQALKYPWSVSWWSKQQRVGIGSRSLYASSISLLFDEPTVSTCPEMIKEYCDVMFSDSGKADHVCVTMKWALRTLADVLSHGRREILRQ